MVPPGTEVGQTEVPHTAALGTHLLLLPRTGLLVTEFLNGICCPEDKLVLLVSLQPARHLSVWVLALRELFFSVWKPFQGSAPFPTVFPLGDSMRPSD